MIMAEEPDALGGGVTSEMLARIARMKMQRIETVADLDNIAFDHGLATVEVNADLLPSIAFKNARRGDAARVAALMRRIEDHGYIPLNPVICRIGRKGKWVVVDGGHRLSALKLLYATSWRRRLASWLRARGWSILEGAARRLNGPPTRIYAILFLGPRSKSKPKAPA
jgi:hypothetical protein